jgi:hypothetical protein
MLEKIESAPTRNPIPFYGSYASFLRGLKGLKEHGIPKNVNPRSLAGILSDEAPRISSGFLSMGWIDKHGRPQEDLKRLVAAFDDDSWKETLIDIIGNGYSFVPGAWSELTDIQLHEAFVSHVGREAKVMKSAETFFLSLALECGVPLTDRLYLRAQRAHSEATRAKTDDDETLESTAPKEQRSDAERSREPSKDVKVAHKKGEEWVSEIVKLSTILSEGNMTDQEKKAIALTISVLARRMNTA